jgi:hypothetical protein
MQLQGTLCPLLKKACVKTECSWFIQVIGKNPQTGQDVNEWACAVAWMPMLTIENSQMQRQTGAAVESFRNVVAKGELQLTGSPSLKLS